MNYRSFLLLVVLGTIISWISWLLVIFYFNPDEAGIFGFLLFYWSLILALFGTFFLAKEGLVAKFNPRQLTYVRTANSFRHALLFAALIIGWGLLKSTGLLTWWNLLLLISILTLLEFFFISSGKQRVKSLHYEPVNHRAPSPEINELNEAEGESIN